MNKIIEFGINKYQANNDRNSEIEELCKNNNPLNVKDVERLFEYLSYIVREKIAEFEGKDIDDYLFPYKCDLAQSMIYYYLNELNIKANPVNTNEVINGVCGHSLIVASINTTLGEKTYLIDPTYIQFFSKEKCDINKFVIINNQVCIAPDPGFFVVNSNNTDILMPLLTNGFIELTEEVAKAYGDSFFQTKQGTSPDQIKNNVASGSDYIKWFRKYTSKLSKKEEELNDMNLLIETNNIERSVKHL